MRRPRRSASLSTAPLPRAWIVGAAELLLGDLAAERAAHHGRPGDEELRRLARHHREMRRRDARRAEARHRTQRRRDHRHRREQLHRDLEVRDVGHVGAAHLRVRLHRSAAAGAVDQPHERQPQVARRLLGPAHLVADRAVGGATAHGEVVAADDDRAAVDAAASAHEVRRRERLRLTGVVVVGAPASTPVSWKLPRRAAARSARAP